MVRAIVMGPACPMLDSDGGRVAMVTRAEPALLPPRAAKEPDVKAMVFPERVCEVAVPLGARGLRVGAQALPAPPAEIRRIVLMGDTGCRMKQSEDAFQDCAESAAWPFAAIAAQAAAKRPDLVLHLGDLHYRESPCPVGKPGCAGSPWGYGHDTWAADFFEPAAPLLRAAPWLVIRGNHESCGRAGVGWFRYLDARTASAPFSCIDPRDDAQADFTPPYALKLTPDTQLIVFDSSAVSGKPYARNDPALLRYVAQLADVAEMAKNRPHNFFANHHPVLGFGPSPSGQPKPGIAGLLQAMQATQPARLLPPGVDVVLNGHAHLFEALDFVGDYPAQLVLGNSGSAQEGTVDAARALQAQPAPGAKVRSFATQPGFGFGTLDREGSRWRLSEWDVAGALLRVCDIDGRRLNCGPAL